MEAETIGKHAGDVAASNGAGENPSSTKIVRRGGWLAVADVLSEILMLFAVVAGSFVLWQTFWTGVEASKTQSQQIESSGWSAPAANADGSTKIAEPQAGDPPVLQQPAYGDLIGQLSIPRFGAKWQRNLVEGTDNVQLARHGLGHYETSQMPGAVGLYAIAGHRAGYGEPLAYINTLQKGDAIVTRTADYWFVYEYVGYKVVDKGDRTALAAVPFDPSKTPTERLMALSSCEPRYYMGAGETPYRWVAYAKLKYWAKTSDGTPKELVDSPKEGTATRFSVGSGDLVDGVAAKMGDLPALLKHAAITWLFVAIAAAVAWGWPGVAKWKADKTAGKARTGLLAWIWRLQPGPLAIRVFLYAVLLVMFLCVMFQWVCPWAATSMPWLAASSNYSTIG